MTACDLLEQCMFYKCQITDLATTTRTLKMRYCKGGGNSACARYIVCKKIGVEKIPENLFPDQLNRLEEILGFM